MSVTYSIKLWDHEPTPVGDSLLDPSVEGEWSGELARLHLGSQNTGLGPQALRAAWRTLRGCWEDDVILIELEDQ